MKKKAEVAVALAILGAVSALCLKLMKAAGERLDREMYRMDREEATEEDFAD